MMRIEYELCNFHPFFLLIMADMTFTATFCEKAENHVGNQILTSGDSHDSITGFTNEELKELEVRLKALNINATLFDFGGPINNKGSLLVIRNGINSLLGDENAANNMWLEHKALEPRWDSKALMGRGSNRTVKNKNARHNLCIADFEQAPSYEEGKGTVIAYGKTIPTTTALRVKIGELIPGKSSDLLAEMNYYYNSSKTYIGFHGDAERHKVIGARLGKSMPMFFQWCQNSKPIGPMLATNFNHGDMYIMSEKTVGRDWMKRSQITLRHAAGQLDTLKKTAGPKKMFENSTELMWF